MIRKIRTGTWETNSSSVHQLIIDVRRPEGDLEVPESIVLRDQEFGWDFGTFDDVQSKANYLFTACTHATERRGFDELVETLVNNLKSIGVKSVKIATPTDDPDFFYGYRGGIDHGNDKLEECVRPIIGDPDRLARFLFLDTSELRTGNDNSTGGPDGWYDHPDGTECFEGGN